MENGWLSKNLNVVVATGALLMTMSVGWANLHGRIAVVETKAETSKETDQEIKDSVKENSRKLDEIKDLLIRGNH